MAPARLLASRSARWRARLAAQSGEALIEVLMTALLVALVSGAVLTGYAQVTLIAGDQRNRVEAAALAQQDEARLRGLTITQLSGSGGNASSTQTIDGTVYTITSQANFISGAAAGAACTTGAVSTADEVQTTSTVTWPRSHAPVVVHGLVSPSEGGSMVVTAVDNSGTTGLAGVTASLLGPTTVSPLTTDSNGCAVFGGLDGGSYTVSFSDPGYVDVNGNSPASQTVTVIPTETAKTKELELGLAGTISASFTTTYTNGSSTTTAPATADQFIAVNSGITAGYRTFGTDSTSTNNAFTAALGTGSTMFPFTSAYSVYAGGCNDSTTPAAGKVAATVAPGNTSSVVLPEPAMVVLPEVAAGSASTVDDPATGNGVTPSVTYAGTWSHNTGVAGDINNTESDSATTNSTVTFTVPALTGGATSGGGASSISWIATTAKANGIANVTLDGVSQNPVDLYSTTTTHQVAVTYSNLDPSTSHTLVIKVSGTKSHAGVGTGTTISVDAFKYTGSTLETSPKPNVTVTDTDSGCANNEDYPPSANAPISATTGALANPGLPWGTYTVCVDNGTKHDTVTGVANTSYTGSNYAYAYIEGSATGYGSGVCT